jgi:hypothetical protein
LVLCGIKVLWVSDLAASINWRHVERSVRQPLV